MERDRPTELSDYVNSLRRRRHLILAIWLPIVITTLLLAAGLPSEYASTATFQLRTDLNDQGRGDNYAERYVSGLTSEVLSSADLRAALAKLQPYPGLAKDSAAMLKNLRGDLHVTMITQKILDPVTGLERNINTGFLVSYANRDPQIAQRVAAWLANAFIMGSRRAAEAQVTSESRFYSAEADRERAKIAASEQRLTQFKQENFDRLPATTQANLGIKGLTEQELQGVERDLRAQQQNRTFILQQLQQARAASANTDTLRALESEYQKKAAVYDPDHPDMIALRQQIDAMRSGGLAAGTSGNLESQLAVEEANLAEMRQRYSEDHPDVKRLERTISNQKARIASGEKGDASQLSSPAVVQLETQLNGVETQIAALHTQRTELQDKLAKLQGRLQATPEVELAYDTLNRELATERRLYEQLDNKRMDADLKAAAIKLGTADQFMLVTPPVVPTSPAKPSRLGIALIGAIGATFLAIMTALAATALDSTVRGSHDVVALLNVAPIVTVPIVRNAEARRRRARLLTTMVATIVVAVPALYFLIRIAVG